MIDYSHGMLVVWTAPRSADGNTNQYRVEWDFGAGFSSQCGENVETQTVVVSNAAANAANNKFALLTDSAANGGAAVGCVAPTSLTSTLLTPLQALGGAYTGATVAVQGDDSATYDYGRTFTMTFPQTVTTPAVGYDVVENQAVATSPVGIPLLYWNAGDQSCTATPPDSVVVQRATYGPGLDGKRGQGRIGVDANGLVTSNECAAALAAQSRDKR